MTQVQGILEKFGYPRGVVETDLSAWAEEEKVVKLESLLENAKILIVLGPNNLEKDRFVGELALKFGFCYEYTPDIVDTKKVIPQKNTYFSCYDMPSNPFVVSFLKSTVHKLVRAGCKVVIGAQSDMSLTNVYGKDLISDFSRGILQLSIPAPTESMRRVKI
jgi:hypothetical protein